MPTELRSRGLRNPRHDFLHAIPSQRLTPIFAMPVRPRETVIGWRTRMDVAITEAVKLALSPLVEIEFGVWKVPISTLGEYFADMFVADFEDSGAANYSVPGPLGSGVGFSGSTPGGDGPNSGTALHNRTRPWAGEMGGQVDAAVRDTARSYSPYVSAATFHVARNYYEMELEQGLGERFSADLWQAPPVIASRNRGMTASAIGANLADDQIPTGGVAEWAERLSLLSRRNRTYGEYLQGFGVPLSRVRSMPEPLMLHRFTLDKDWRTVAPTATALQGSSTYAFPTTVQGRVEYTGYATRRLDEIGGTAPNMFGSIHDSGAGMVHSQIDMTRKRRLIIDEPSIILGTLLVYDMAPGQNVFDHVADITRLISGSLWGDNNSDEIDFITSQLLPGAIAMNRNLGMGEPQNPTINAGFGERNQDGQAGPYVMNALNLFLNGERWSNDVWAFRHLPQYAGLVASIDALGGEVLNQRRFQDTLESLQLTAIGYHQHGVATELVS